MKDTAPTPAPGKALMRRIAMLQDAMAPARALRIADVGANPINVPDYAGLQAMGAAEVWGFEPDEDAFAALQAETQTGAHFVKRAVGPTGKGQFYPHRLSGLGSLYPIDAKRVRFLGRPSWHTNQGDPLAMELIALDDLNEDELPKPDVLKMDIQGGELAVLQTGRTKLSETIAIIPEVRFYRIYEGEPIWAEVDAELRAQGFMLHKLGFNAPMPIGNSLRNQMKSNAFRNQILDGDAIYIRDTDTVEAWSDEQIKQLAITASGVINSHDLVIYCLDQLVARGVVSDDAPQAYFDSLPKWMRK